MKSPNLFLTKREVEVLKLCAKGLSNPEIADNLMISIHTVKAHIENILAKLEVSNRILAILKAIKLGIIEIEI